MYEGGRMNSWMLSLVCFSLPVSLLVSFSATQVAAAETDAPVHGVSSKEIKVGVSLPLSGSVSGLGHGLQKGFSAYFAKTNAKGGVHGRKIVTTILDDAYEPERASKNAQQLIMQNDSFALFNFVGTPTSRAAVPLARKHNVPYLFAFTGAEFLRTPADPVIFNLRASYFDETETLVDHFVKDLGLQKIGIFAQGDAYGDAGLSGVVKALAKRNLKLVGEGRYKRNEKDISDGFGKVIASHPEAVILIGSYEPCAEFIKRARAENVTFKIANISFVGTEDLIRAAGRASNGTYVSEIMPSPLHSHLPLVQQYRKEIGTRDIGYTSLEGYVNAAFLVELLNKTGQGLTREKFMSTLESYSGEIGGMKAGFSSKSHQAFDRVYLTQIKDEKPVEIDKM
jgi:branched-chain amino acid transport system substrate-binding protein